MLISIWDETLPGTRVPGEPIALDQTSLTVRELIQLRIRSEVERFNQTRPDVFQGLVQPEQSEQILNGFRVKSIGPLDADAQYRRACSSFERNGFLLLIDGTQYTDLDAQVEFHEQSEVQFIKLVPLIGG